MNSIQHPKEGPSVGLPTVGVVFCDARTGLGAFTKLLKLLLASSYVCLSVHMEQLGSHCKDIHET